MKKYAVGDKVRYIPSYKGYYAAEVVGFDGTRIIIEFSSGKQISCWADELEDL
jgi:hypothetical protein